MQLTHLFVSGLLSGLVAASPAHVRRGVDCSFSVAAASGSTCESFAKSWDMSMEELKSLNPGVSCPTMDTTKEYCVLGTVNDDPDTTTPAPTATSATSKPGESTPPPATTTDSGNGIATPLPTQPGMTSRCNKFYFIGDKVTCSKVLEDEKISMAILFRLNPSVLADCSGMWAGVNVCVGVIGGSPPTSSTSPTTTVRPSPTTTPGNGVQTPLPTQPGMVTNCAKFHFVGPTTTCSQILSYQKISLANFVQWNPTVGSSCNTMQAGVNVCVGVIGGNPPTSTTVQPTPTKPAGNGVQTPLPTQPGMVDNCKKFHYVSEGNTCGQIISYQKITLADFVRWNTGVGSDCRTMWQKAYVCVGV